MKKTMIIATSLFVVGGAALGVAAAGNDSNSTKVQSVQPVKQYAESKITAKEAGERALAYLGGGSIDEIELETKNGSLVYEVDVDTLYEDGDIYVDAYTGEIVHVDDDLLFVHESSMEINVTKEEAIEIAFNKVGIGKIDDLDIERKNGRMVYEIEIEHSDDRESELKIDAISGEILSIEWDD